MKKRSKLRRVMFIPPMLVLSIMWSGNSNAMNPLIMPQLIEANIFRTLAVVDDDKDEYVTRPEDIQVDGEEKLDQKSIEDAAIEVVEQTDGALPKDTSSVEILAENNEEGQIEQSDETDELDDQVACAQEENTEDVTEEMEKLKAAMISDFTEFFKTAFLPMYLNNFAAKNFKAPEYYTGYAGIAAQHQSSDARLGLNLLSLSDYFNTRSIGMVGPFTQNVYNITNEYQTGFNSGFSTPMSVPNQNANFNNFIPTQMLNNTNAGPYNYNFNSLSVQNHSRFDQFNTINKTLPTIGAGPMPASTVVPSPATVISQPMPNTNLPTMRHMIPE